MLDFIIPRKKQAKTFVPQEVVLRLTDLNPPSALVFLQKNFAGSRTEENLGKAFFLQRDRKVYSEGPFLYITTPEGLKVEKSVSFQGKSETVVLQFLHRRVPYKLECLLLGHFRILPEIVETLDFNVKAAFKLQPLGPIKKEDKRHFLRYTVKNYGDPRVPLTTYVSFDAYVKATNRDFPYEGAPPMELRDLRPIPFKAQAFSARRFDPKEVIDQFRGFMLSKQPTERFIHLAKLVKVESSRRVRKFHDELLLLGYVSVLGLEKEQLRSIIYIKKSAKADNRKDNPYNLRSGERVLVHFAAGASYYELLCEVVESRIQNEVLRPISPIAEEGGLKVELVEYSVGGALIESNPELLKMLLKAQVPGDGKEQSTYEGRHWERIFDELKRPMIHLTFYPRLHFPDNLKQFQPELPFKIPIIAQITRTHLHTHQEKQLLQHGLRFSYDLQEAVLNPGDMEVWKLIRGTRDNPYFAEIHSKLSQLYGYLENQSALMALSRVR